MRDSIDKRREKPPLSAEPNMAEKQKFKGVTPRVPSYPLKLMKPTSASLGPVSYHLLAWSLIVATGLVAVASVPAGAAFLEVSPVRIEAVVTDGSALPPIIIRNREAQGVIVRISAVEGRHDQDGIPVWDGPPVWDGTSPGRASSETSHTPAAILEISPREVFIPAGGIATIRPTVRVLRRNAGGAYPMILIEARPSPIDGSEIVTVSRMVVITLLRFPWALPGKGAIEGFDVEGVPGGGPLRFSCIFRNTGDVDVTPSGSISIRSGAGDLILTVPVRTGAVLPGMVRRFVAEVDPPPLLAGKYTAELLFSIGGLPAGKSRIAFLVAEGNKLATVGVE